MRVLSAVSLCGVVAWALNTVPPPVVFEVHPFEFVLRNAAEGEKHQVETMPAGVAVLDYDNDGWEDLFFVNGAEIPTLRKAGPQFWNRLYHNNRDGTFADVTEKAGLRGDGYGMAVAAGDYDNDGYADLFVAGVRRNTLYHNNGDGTFSDVTARAGIASTPWSISAAWLDYDNDGRLDLFISNYCKWDPAEESFCGLPKPGYRSYCHPRYYEGLPNSLFHNDGNGRFTDVSVASGIAAHIGKGMGVSVADYDDDGRPDIFVANDTVRNFLFHNEGGGKFTEIGVRAGVALNDDGIEVSGMGADFRDYDNDGLPDVFVSALSNDKFTLFRNLGRGSFRDVTYQSRLGFLSVPLGGWSSGLYDLNNDGWKDIFVAGSHVMDNEELYSSRASKQTNHIFVNQGNGTFVLAEARGARRFHRGAAFGDFDNDGRIDVAVSCLNERAEIWMNRSPRNHWLELRLQGKRSNRDGLGAKIRMTLPDNREQWNYATTSVGYASSSTPRIHFGMGAAEKARRIDIQWPSGISQVLENVAADQVLLVNEP